MRNRTTAIIVGVSMLVFTGGVVAFAMLRTSAKQPSTNASVALAAVSPANAAPQDGPATLGVQSGDASQNGLDLQGNLGTGAQSGSGASGTANSTANSSANGSASSAAPKIPTPDQFGMYDQYKDKDTALFSDLVVGTGSEVAAGTTVAVTYKGWLTNGKLFDESTQDDNGKLQAFKFTVGDHKVIPGWEQDIVGMKVGGTRRFVIPPSAGYGAEGHDPVPPNAVLVFDVTLAAAL